MGVVIIPLRADNPSPKKLNLPAISCDLQVAPSNWASYQRKLIDSLDRAGILFYNTYVEADGTVTYKERYEGGMNSSDDLYEGFRGFSLHTALGGSAELDERHRKVWEGITRQFTRYGQIYREFDSNWDWMHHGEGYVSFYPLGMVEPNDPVFRERAIRFAAMYIGDDPEAQNYDPKLKQMRAVMTGSRGPKMEWNKRDWIPTNGNLVNYPLPFYDIPGITASTAWINDHPANDQFVTLVKAMSDRMAKGDVPINLTVTPLIASAYLYTGDQRYVDWVKGYVGRWEELTARNNGITPDNVGLSGEIGEYTGHWWGGYYGWVWPRGGMDVIRAQLTAAKVATLLTGSKHWAELPRSQMKLLRDHGEVRDGIPMIPNRFDQRGWHHFTPEPGFPYVNLWLMSHAEEDWQQIKRLAEAQQLRGGITDPALQWAYFVKGLNPDYPERAMANDLRTIANDIAYIQNERGDPETWVDNKWSSADPMSTGSLTELSIGAMPVDLRGEMLHSQLRYFDGERRKAGLPPDVSALVKRIEPGWVEVEIMNLNSTQARSLVVQGGAYGEHRIQRVEFDEIAKKQPEPNSRRRQAPLAKSMSSQTVNGIAFVANVAPGSGATLRIHLERYSNKPSYTFPWDR